MSDLKYTQQVKAQVAGVYMLFDGADLVYIGESNHIFRRIAQHFNHKKGLFDSFRYFVIDDERLRKGTEMFLINILRPKLNEDVKCPATPSARAGIAEADPLLALIDYYIHGESYGMNGDCEHCCARDVAGRYFASLMSNVSGAQYMEMLNE